MEKEEEKNVDQHFFFCWGKKKGFNPSFWAGRVFQGFVFYI